MVAKPVFTKFNSETVKVHKSVVHKLVYFFEKTVYLS